MYLQEILEVGIGLVFMWLVLSIAVMQTQEWISNIFNWRAKDLEQTIRGLLSNDEELTRKIYNHPLIASLYRDRQTRRNPRLPSYIPPDKFVLALFDLAMTAGTEASPLRKIFKDVHTEMDNFEDPDQRKLAQEDWVAILGTARTIASSGLGQAAVDSLKLQIHAYADKYPEMQGAIELAMPQVDLYYETLLADQRAADALGQSDLTLRQVRLGVIALQSASPELKATLTTLLQNAETVAEKGEQAVAAARTSVEGWFNNAMDRLSGAYKRKAQLVSFIIGIAFALLLNVDSINIATSLWREPTLRQAIVAQADQYLDVTAEIVTDTGESADINLSISDLKDQLAFLTLPFGWHTAPFDTGGKQCAYIPLSANQVIGFPSVDSNGNAICKQIDNIPIDLPGWLSKVFGILISGFAAAQGAPFWFDLLRKMVNVRGTGTKPGEN
ncbi:MAG: hypothetical protein JXB85_06540 [Anaerolineales bacterium]|nr:hypothetical protein [Anaerolineales bacterium]